VAFQVGRSRGPSASHEYDPGYLTTVPGNGGAVLRARPGIRSWLAYDEATKGVVAGPRSPTPSPVGFTLPHVAGIPPAGAPGHRRHDALFCGHLLAATAPLRTDLREEAPYFANAASFTAATLPDSGHDLDFAPTPPSTRTA